MTQVIQATTFFLFTYMLSCSCVEPLCKCDIASGLECSDSLHFFFYFTFLVLSQFFLIHRHDKQRRIIFGYFYLFVSFGIPLWYEIRWHFYSAMSTSTENNMVLKSKYSIFITCCVTFLDVKKQNFFWEEFQKLYRMQCLIYRRGWRLFIYLQRRDDK